jgi:hypothetical protein
VASWTVGKLLDHIQEILGEPVGGFYNISTRLDLMNQAQRELNHETRAITDSASISVTAGQRDYPIPADFLTFDREAPVFSDGTTRTHLEVVDPADLDRRFHSWQDTTHQGTPMYLFVRNGTITLYPTPQAAGTLHFPYIVEPTDLVNVDDVPFNGLPQLNRFAPALAYKVAFQDLFERQERLMRHHVRSSPQHKPGIQPGRERREHA